MAQDTGYIRARPGMVGCATNIEFIHISLNMQTENIRIKKGTRVLPSPLSDPEKTSFTTHTG